LGTFTVAETVVPLGPITSNGSVVMVGGGLELAVNQTEAVADFVESATLVAMIATV
jgi:hypothetical protein